MEGYGVLEEDLGVGSTVTATSNEDGTISLHGPMPQGMKLRRSRVFGTCRCPECGQTFVNTARLERHLAVHQVFGSYLCPLCGKTYKYEYNLFYHWRRTCRDLNELMSMDERKIMDVNGLRQLVDEVAAKKAELGTLAYPFRHMHPGGSDPPPPRQEIPQGRRGEACPECGVVVLASHMEKHMAIHRGEVPVDTKGVAGGFFCDLCGLMFRQHFNLIKHWRTNCPEIQMQIDPDMDLTMDDETLKQLVEELLRKKGLEEQEAQAHHIRQQEQQHPSSSGTSHHPSGPRKEIPKQRIRQTQAQHQAPPTRPTQEMKSASGADKEKEGCAIEERTKKTETKTELIETDGPGPEEEEEREEKPWVGQGQPPALQHTEEHFQDQAMADDLVPEHIVQVDVDSDEAVDVTTVVADGRHRSFAETPPTSLAPRWPPMRREEEEEEEYTGEFADDDPEPEGLERYAATPPPPPGHPGQRAKWSMIGGPVQCPECFRSFANEGRLERHLSGFHASYGTHHCILCGNRFKYDYNLLYHYRRSCPYTKAFIDRDVREQMEAPSLRKLVRNLAQKEVRLTPHVAPPPKLPSQSETPRPRLAMRYPSNQPPAHLLMPRPGMPEGKTCPVCGIIFYGNQGLQRHMQATHPAEWEEWRSQGGMDTPDHEIFTTSPKERKFAVEAMERREEASGKVPEKQRRSLPGGGRTRIPGKGVMERPPTKKQKLTTLDLGAAPLPAKPGKEAAEIDPTLESSIATFLSEMRQEAAGNSRKQNPDQPQSHAHPSSATRPAREAQKVIYVPISRPRNEVVEEASGGDETGEVTVSVESEALPEEFMDLVQESKRKPVEYNIRSLHPPPPPKRIVTADFEEDLDVEGEDSSIAMGEVLQEMKFRKSPKRRRGPPIASPSFGVRKTSQKEPPTCLHCFKTFLTNAHLMKHAKIHRKAEDAGGEEPLTDCQLCGMKFREEAGLISHWRSERCAKIGRLLTEKKQLDGMDPDQLKRFVKNSTEKSGGKSLEKNFGRGTNISGANLAPRKVENVPQKGARESGIVSVEVLKTSVVPVGKHVEVTKNISAKIGEDSVSSLGSCIIVDSEQKSGKKAVDSSEKASGKDSRSSEKSSGTPSRRATRSMLVEKEEDGYSKAPQPSLRVTRGRTKGMVDHMEVD